MKKRNVSTKLTITYVIFIVILILTFGMIFYQYNKKTIYREGINMLSQIADSTIVQVDARLNAMEQTVVDTLSNPNFLDLWITFQKEENEKELEIKRILTSAFQYKSDVRRVSVFDCNGNYVSTGETKVTKEGIVEKVKLLESENDFTISDSRIFIESHVDDWNNTWTGKVVSMVKPIKDEKKQIVGYIEVQQNIFYIDSICNVFWKNNPIDIAILNENDYKLFYANFDWNTYFEENKEEMIRSFQIYAKTIDVKNGVLAIGNSNFFNSRVVILLDNQILFESLNTIKNGILIVCFILILATVIYNLVATRLIMRPINTFIKRMKTINIENYRDHMPDKEKDYETYILQSTFEDMAQRLYEAMKKQKKVEEIQTKTLFSILQSETSPHFLYNTLGSIANLCENGDSEAAADACYSLTEIIRYSSNYKDSEVTVKEEVQNLKSYFSIIKSRYRQRVNFELNIDDHLACQLIPKLTLQPLVENAIKYSLLEEEHVNIQVYGVVFGREMIFEIKDNGIGMSEDAIKLVETRIHEFENSSQDKNITDRIKIGGMGLSGTLIRLMIFFDGKCSYEISNKNDKGGTTIVLRMPIE